MIQRGQRETNRSLLPEHIAKALIADVDCEAVIEHLDTDGRVVVSVPRIEDADGVRDGDYSALYQIGNGYIIAEGSGASYSEFLAIERSYLPLYLDTICNGKHQQITHNATADMWWLNRLDHKKC